MSKDTVKKGQGFSGRLTALRKELGIRQQDAAEKFGVSVATYRNWEKGRSEPQQFSNDQVLDMLRGSNREEGDPIYDSPASAGDGSMEVREDPIGYMPPSQSLSSAGRNVFWMPVIGDSMGEKYQRHTLVPVAKFEDPITDFSTDDVYVIRWDGATKIKRLQRLGDKRVRIISDSADYPNEEIQLDEEPDFRILGRVLV